MTKRAASALCAVEPPPQPRPVQPVQPLQLPLTLYLSRRIPAEQAAALAARVAADPKAGLHIADSEEGALHVLPKFEIEELAALQRRKKRVVGLPFVERLLKDRSLLEKVVAVPPLFDLIYRSEKAFCFSAMTDEDRTRYQALATWVGVRVTDDVGPGTELLVARKVSLRPDSKYQKALAMRLPIVRPSYLEALWDEQRLVDKEPHFLPPLAGLAINFGPIQDQVSQELQNRAAASGALITTLDKADLVIVADASRPVYKEGRALGLGLAPPLWLQRCLQIRCCLQICGELEVPQAGVPSGGRLASVEAHTSDILLDCVLCLLYLDPGRPREEATHMAWRCGAWTTLDAKDPAVTHVLFDIAPSTVVAVSAEVDEDRHFLDVRWLEACLAAGKRVFESEHLSQRVYYNPVLDVAYSALFQSDLGASAMVDKARSEATSVPKEPGAKGSQVVEAAGAEPAKPLARGSMPGLTIRITALDDSRQSSRERQRLQEMVQNLGAKVADHASRLGDITHFVCVVPDRLEAGLTEKAKKRKIHLVSVQWLLDCHQLGSRQPEARYSISISSTPSSSDTAPLLDEEAVGKASSCVAATVLAKCDVFVSPWALGVEPKLMQMAKELGASSVRSWRSPAELQSCLQAPAEGQARAVVVAKEEARQGSLEPVLETLLVDAAAASELRSLFVQPSWLQETYAQRRRLPLSSFAAFSEAEDAPSAPRVAPEAAYAWQPAEMKRLEEVAEQARAREVESKAQERVSQGLRLADLGC